MISTPEGVTILQAGRRISEYGELAGCMSSRPVDVVLVDSAAATEGRLVI
jgi:hypothetical protein